jgi:hypothetical protein
MRRWTKEGWSLRAIFDYALDLHASFLNNKSAPLPGGARPEIERFLRRLGYRLVLRSLRHPASVARGASAPVAMTWENVGVAPPYLDFVLGLRLSGADRSKAHVFAGKTSVKGWLPGKVEASEPLSVPAGLSPGSYDLSVAILDPATKQPVLRLAVEGRGEDGWYRAGRIDVK